ncbi:hypothetical protein BHE74_00015760 [Ensete ventricosum]|nr:hypothetical protein BHE74_00015760 [Ensete ventricosum]
MGCRRETTRAAAGDSGGSSRGRGWKRLRQRLATTSGRGEAVTLRLTVSLISTEEEETRAAAVVRAWLKKKDDRGYVNEGKGRSTQAYTGMGSLIASRSLSEVALLLDTLLGSKVLRKELVMTPKTPGRELVGVSVIVPVVAWSVERTGEEVYLGDEGNDGLCQSSQSLDLLCEAKEHLWQGPPPRGESPRSLNKSLVLARGLGWSIPIQERREKGLSPEAECVGGFPLWGAPWGYSAIGVLAALVLLVLKMLWHFMS